MKVLKFGGTSVGNVQRIKNVAKLITESGNNVVVLSAMAGVTNTLVEITDYFYKNNTTAAMETITNLQRKYANVVNELFNNATIKQVAEREIRGIFNYLRTFSSDGFDEVDEKEILAQGEIMSTIIMNLYLRQEGYNSAVINALDFMRTNANDEPDMDYITYKLEQQIAKYSDAEYLITQGFICRNAAGNVDNLQRGGSDYTASLIGAAIKAEEVQIWTDIDGMHNNDPRYVDNTKPVGQLNFDEAAELAYFGAKVLHPTCVLPAKLANIPVRLLNTLQPEAKGTLINNNVSTGTIKAVAAKDKVTAITIKSGRRIQSHSFLRKVFETFETYRTPIDMITTSEVGVAVTIDNERQLENIVDELRKIGTVAIDHDMVIICVVGDLSWHNCGFEAKAVDALKNIPIRMISYGGSNYNISMLVKKEDKLQALKQLSEHLF
jgi:aspartate kinase